jgi:hypothetical protein
VHLVLLLLSWQHLQEARLQILMMVVVQLLVLLKAALERLDGGDGLRLVFVGQAGLER